MWLVSQWQPVAEPFTNASSTKRIGQSLFYHARPRSSVWMLGWAMLFPSSGELCQTKLQMSFTSYAVHGNANGSSTKTLPPAQGLPQPICVCGMNWLCPEGWRFTGRQCLTERTWEPLWISVQFTIYIYTYIHIYIYTYTHLHIYIYTYTFTHIHIHIYIYTYTYTHIHIHIYIYTYTHIHIHLHIYTYTYTHIHLHIYIYTYTYTHTHIHIHIHIMSEFFFFHTYCSYVHMYIYIYTCYYIVSSCIYALDSSICTSIWLRIDSTRIKSTKWPSALPFRVVTSH